MNEEAGFIAALLAEPDDRTTLLVYADWLDERADPRAEYLRLLAAQEPDLARRAVLCQVLDTGWVQLIGSRSFGPGCRVKYKAPADSDTVFDLTTITAERPGATIRLTLWHRSRTFGFGWWELEVVKR